MVKRGPGVWEAPALGLPFDAVRRLRSTVLASALQDFAPDLLLVDHMPHGAMGELVPALEMLRPQLPHMSVVLGLRDIVDAPETVQRRWTIEGAYDALERFYDHVFIYGSPDLYDAALLYDFPGHLRARTTYCGYLVSPRGPSGVRVAAARRLFMSPGRRAARRVLVIGGSGHDAAPMMATAVRSLSRLNAEAPTAMVVVCGPNMSLAERAALDSLANEHGARVVRAISDPSSTIRAADAVVAMAGYNSTIEILESGTPAVLVPRSGPSAEQRTRARLFADRGWVDVVDPDDLNEASLAAAVETALRRGRAPWPNGLQLTGLDQTVAHLSLLLDGLSISAPRLAHGNTDGTP